MMKRALSLLLSLLMILSLFPAAVSATETNEDVYISGSESLSDLIDSGVVSMGGNRPTVQAPTHAVLPETNSPSDSENSVVIRPNNSVVEPVTYECVCGKMDAQFENHSDNCTQKQHYISACSGTAVDIYDVWYAADTNGKAFLLRYLESVAPEKLVQVQELIEAGAIPGGDPDDDVVERLSGEASATYGDVTVEALGVPEGSSLTIQKPSQSAMDKVEAYIENVDTEPEQLFQYDISVQNDESTDWQPDNTSVKMSLSLEGVKLPKYSIVKIVHVGDDGVATTLEAEVNENGEIVFETEGFSTFAGFTVDFEYGSAFYSMPGMTAMYLSELFDSGSMSIVGVEPK